MLKFLIFFLFIFTFFLFPFRVIAQKSDFDLKIPSGLGITVQPGSTPYAESIVERIIVNVVGIFFAVGGLGVVVYFIWGTVDWILSGGDKEKKDGARKKKNKAKKKRKE